MRSFTPCFAVLLLATAAQALDYDFEDAAQLKDWKVIEGDWKVENAVLHGQNEPAAGGFDHGPGIVVGEDKQMAYIV